MTTTRRTFLQTTAAVGGALGAGLLARAAMASPSETASSGGGGKMRILVLGGTGLIGPHLVRYAVARGHAVSTFTRGKTEADLPAGVERLVGDRADNLEALKGKTWDVVIDDSSSIPAWTRATAELLKDSVGRYLFTSSISVYADVSKPGVDENGKLAEISEEEAYEVSDVKQVLPHYGALKVKCEEAARRVFGDRAIVVRPGLIVGPYDRSDRFTYWPVRIARGGEVLAPGTPEDPVQFIDVRDLAEWYVRLLDADGRGTYNATGPYAPLGMAEMLYGIRAVTTKDCDWTWVDADFLEKQEPPVQAWSEMTVWVPPTGEYAGFAQIDVSRAVGHGLTFRPLADTARDTLAWFESLPDERRSKMRAGLPADREREVLAAWHARGAKPAAS